MGKEKAFIKHKNFGELSKEEVLLYLDFVANVMYNLNGFEVWEAENVHDKDDDAKWDTEAAERYGKIIDAKCKLENKIYGNFIK